MIVCAKKDVLKMLNELRIFVKNHSQVISIDMLLDLCRLFNVTPSELLDESIPAGTKEDVKRSLAIRPRYSLDDLKQPYLTVPDVAKLYGVKEFTVRDWVRKGRITAIKIGGTAYQGGMLRFRQEDIDEFNRNNCTEIIF